MLLLVAVLVNLCIIDVESAIKCYHCTDVAHTYDCAKTETCSSTEVCYIESRYDANNRLSYSQGCIPSHVCGDEPVNSIIGRAVNRRQEELSEFTCCSTNQCNQHHVEEVDGLVFRITPHIGGDVYQAWLNGNMTSSLDSCRNVRPAGCSVHYRNNAIDNWTNLNITVVKYALYVKEQEVAYIYFNATGSDMTNWFSKDRVINSTWLDIKTTPSNKFGIAVDFPPNRRFYINKEWGGCDNDRGWTIVVSGPHVCNFDNQKNDPYPYILYAKGNKYGHYLESNQIGEADVAAVYIYHE